MTPTHPIALLESAHPHIAVRVQALWGMPECGAYLTKLMLPDQTNHIGFEDVVLLALHELQELHNKLFPPPISDVWGDV